MGTFLIDWLIELLAPANKQKGPLDLLKLVALIGAGSFVAVVVLGE